MMMAVGFLLTEPSSRNAARLFIENFMASATHSNHAKPVLGRVSPPMMILFGLLVAMMAFEISCWKKPIRGNGVIDGVFGVEFFGIFLTIFAVASAVRFFARLCLPIFSVIGFFAGFAIALKPARFGGILVKVGGGKKLLALGAAFCLNRFRHILSFTKSMLKAVCGLRPADGFVYCICSNERVNYHCERVRLWPGL